MDEKFFVGKLRGLVRGRNMDCPAIEIWGPNAPQEAFLHVD